MEIDFSRIRQKAVKKFLLRFGIGSSEQLALLQPLCYHEASGDTYRKHEETFLVKEDIETVWKVYAGISPKEAWNAGMVSFGVQFSPGQQSLHYFSDPGKVMEEGQILLLNLKLLGGLVNIAVAHAVAEINSSRRVIKLCYMQGGASEGSQWISFKEAGPGQTKVTHLTLYKSNSSFRDKILYPPLHTKAISEFHALVIRKVMAKKK